MSEPLPLANGSVALDPLTRDALVLLAGWALGIASSPITDSIRRWSAKRRLTRTLRTELVSLQDMLASVVVQVAKRHGELTHPLLEALMATLTSSGQGVGNGKAARAIDTLLRLDDSALASAPAPEAPPARESLSLKVSGAPFLASHVHRLDLYSTETQRLLVEIQAGLEVFDQHAGEATKYHLMSFGSAADGNHLDTLANNVETCYRRAAEKASDLVSRIAALLQSPEMRAT